MDKMIVLNGKDLTLEDIFRVSVKGIKAELHKEAVERIKASRKIVEDIVKNQKIVYGITTGFGKFSDVAISKDQCKTLQKNLILSHACGYGEFLPKHITRAIMLLRINALCKGHSGISMETLNTLLLMLNNNVHPLIPEKGSLGASGDLAPLSHMVLPMIGEGIAEYEGAMISGKDAMNRAGINTIELTYKEGLALINGTQVMTGVGVIALKEALDILKLSDIAASLTLEALRGVRNAFDLRLHKIRPHKGQINTAENILALTEESTFLTSQGEIRVQDAYTLRCIPQIHGASKDAVNYVNEKINIEVNSVTDNPIVFENGDVISGGNFHGQPMALSFDFLGIAMAEVANVSERRLERLINHQLNDLPAFLTSNGGLNSGFMITQYAAAALVSENKILSHPASVDSIPSSANQEDHVSMGTIAARKALNIIKNTRRVLATEILAACQGIDFRKGLSLGKGTNEAYKVVRNHIDFISEDKLMYDELEKCTALLENGQILEAVEAVVELKL